MAENRIQNRPEVMVLRPLPSMPGRTLAPVSPRLAELEEALARMTERAERAEREIEWRNERRRAARQAADIAGHNNGTPPKPAPTKPVCRACTGPLSFRLDNKQAGGLTIHGRCDACKAANPNAVSHKAFTEAELAGLGIVRLAAK